MAAGVQKAWSATASSNANSDSNINFAEGQAPSTVNDSARAVMAGVKAFANQIGGAKTSGGSSNAYTFTSDSAGAISTAYAAGMIFRFKADKTNTGAATFNADGVGAVDIRKGGAQTALVAGDIVQNGIYDVSHNGTYFILLNPETGQGAAGFQPLDATLTALAALQTTTVAPLINGLLFGCTLSNNGSDATNDIDIAAGTCADYTGAQVVTVAALTKQLDANWAAGTNQGMRYSGAAITNTTYHIYVAWKADGTQDIYADPSAVYATVLTHLQAETGGSGYLYLRRIGSIIRASGAILPFVQDGDRFMLKTPRADVTATNPGTSAVNRTLSVPAGLRLRALLTVALATAVTTDTPVSGYVYDLSLAAIASSTTNATVVSYFPGTDVVYVGGQGECMTNTSSQVGSVLQASAAGTIFYISTRGWVDPRGRES